MLETIAIVVGCVGGVGGVVFGIMANVTSAKSFALQREKFEKYETNCIATLNTKVQNLEETAQRHHDDLVKLFDDQREIVKQLYKIKGKLGINGD